MNIDTRLKRTLSGLATSLLILPVLLSFPQKSMAATDGLFQDVIAFGSGTGASVVVFDMEIDSSGNYFIAGRYYGTAVDFDPTSGTDIHNSGAVNEVDAFITKINSDGSYGWTRVFGGTDDEWDQVHSISVDSSDNVYLYGTFASASVDFDGTSGTDIKTRLGETNNCFATKYLSNGDYGWTLTAGSASGTLRFNEITTDTSGNTYVGGLYTGTQDLDLTSGGTDSRTAVGVDGYLSRYDTDGNYAWTLTDGLSGGNFNYQNMETDNSGNLYASGWFQGTVDFDPTAGTDTLSQIANATLFISKYSTSGGYSWTRITGDPTDNQSTFSDDIGIDSSGNLLITGEFWGTDQDFDGTAGTDIYSSTNNSGDAFITKYYSNGTYGWTRTFGHSTEQDSPRGLGINISGDVFITGWFKSGEDVDFDGTSGTDFHRNMPSSSLTTLSGIFFTKYNADGSYGWTHIVDGTQNYGYEIQIIGNEVYSAGSYYQISDFDDGLGTAEKDSSIDGKGYILHYQDIDKTAISNLASGLDVEDVSTGLDAEIESAYLNSTNRDISLTNTSGIVLASIVVDLTSIRDWNTVTGETNTTEGKAFIHNLTSSPGAASSYTLYIPRLGSIDSIIICPDATSLSEVTPTCNGAYELASTDSDVSQVTIGVQNYWAVANLSGTGGMEGTLSQETSSTTSTTTGGISGADDTLPETGLFARTRLIITLGIVLMALGVNSLILRNHLEPYFKKLRLEKRLTR